MILPGETYDQYTARVGGSEECGMSSTAAADAGAVKDTTEEYDPTDPGIKEDAMVPYDDI